MFKNVEYTGFGGLPALKAKAEQLTPVLANAIRGACGEVEVLWTPQAGASDGSLRLGLVRTLPVGVVGAAHGTFTPDDLSEPWLTRSRCRDVWSDLLEDLSRLLDARIHHDLAEMAEV